MHWYKPIPWPGNLIIEPILASIFSLNSFVPIDIKKVKDDKSDSDNYEHSLFTTVDENSEVESELSLSLSDNSDKKTAIRKFKIEQKKIVDNLIKILL